MCRWKEAAPHHPHVISLCAPCCVLPPHNAHHCDLLSSPRRFNDKLGALFHASFAFAINWSVVLRNNNWFVFRLLCVVCVSPNWEQLSSRIAAFDWMISSMCEFARGEKKGSISIQSGLKWCYFITRWKRAENELPLVASITLNVGFKGHLGPLHLATLVDFLKTTKHPCQPLIVFRVAKNREPWFFLTQ